MRATTPMTRKTGQKVGSGLRRAPKMGGTRKVTAGRNRPATGSRLRTARPKRGAAGGRGY